MVYELVDGILINLGGFTYISVALCDVFVGVDLLVVEVHLFNVFVCEIFWYYLYVLGIVVGVVLGFGVVSYWLGFEVFLGYLCV